MEHSTHTSRGMHGSKGCNRGDAGGGIEAEEALSSGFFYSSHERRGWCSWEGASVVGGGCCQLVVLVILRTAGLGCTRMETPAGLDLPKALAGGPCFGIQEVQPWYL